jgi:hypothetical protein
MIADVLNEHKISQQKPVCGDSHLADMYKSAHRFTLDLQAANSAVLIQDELIPGRNQ